MLTFNDTAHQYFWNGAPVPNVTRILAPLTDYSHIPADTLQRAQDEGVAIHKMVELDCLGTLRHPLPEWMRGRFDAWLRFKDETGFECVATERRMFHEQLGYAGTADLFGVLHKTALSGITNIDVKRSLYAGPAIGLQTAAYREQWNRLEPKDRRARHRAALVLRDDGTYRLPAFDDADDWPAFLALLTAHKWKEKHHVRSA